MRWGLVVVMLLLAISVSMCSRGCNLVEDMYSEMGEDAAAFLGCMDEYLRQEPEAIQRQYYELQGGGMPYGVDPNRLELFKRYETRCAERFALTDEMREAFALTY